MTIKLATGLSAFEQEMRIEPKANAMLVVLGTDLSKINNELESYKLFCQLEYYNKHRRK
jgi:hypothetical protein